MKLTEFQGFMDKAQQKSVFGCGNHGCCIMPPEGMGTNSGCTCGPRHWARDLRRMAEALEKQTQWEDEDGNHGH